MQSVTLALTVQYRAINSDRTIIIVKFVRSSLFGPSRFIIKEIHVHPCSVGLGLEQKRISFGVLWLVGKTVEKLKARKRKG